MHRQYQMFVWCAGLFLGCALAAVADTGSGTGGIAKDDPPCQTFSSTDVPKATPPFGVVTSTLTVEESVIITDINVQLSITHDYPTELQAAIQSPSGTWVSLFDNLSGWGSNFTNTVLDDQASSSIRWDDPPFNGVFYPEGRLAKFIGENAQGVWTLRIRDTEQGDGGALTAWQIRIDCTPGEPLETTAELCPDNSIYAQLPAPPYDDWNGAFSDGDYQVYENFSGVSGAITGIRWWGIMGFSGDCVRDPNQYVIEIYEDGGDGPGDLLHEQVVIPAYESTGILYNTDMLLYRFDATLNVPLVISSGWISIYGDGEGSCWFSMTDSFDGDAYSRQWAGPRLQYLTYDHAFCLLGEGGEGEGEGEGEGDRKSVV